MEIITEELVKKIITPRKANSHKGDYGKILLVGGCKQYGGAICLGAKACLFSGAGLVTVACEESVRLSVRQLTPEVMTLNYEDFPTLAEIFTTFNVIVLGSGLGLDDTAKKIFHFVLTHQEKHQYLIIDGSGISLFAKENPHVNFPEKIIFTPHEKEWERLAHLPISLQTPENNQKAQEKLKSMCVVKSHETTVYSWATPWKNIIGTPAQAVGGMGDTLAGIIAGFLGQFSKDNPPEEVVAAGVFCHSYAAKLLAERKWVALPSELAELLPTVMKHFSS